MQKVFTEAEFIKSHTIYSKVRLLRTCLEEAFSANHNGCQRAMQSAPSTDLKLNSLLLQYTHLLCKNCLTLRQGWNINRENMLITYSYYCKFVCANMINCKMRLCTLTEIRPLRWVFQYCQNIGANEKLHYHKQICEANGNSYLHLAVVFVLKCTDRHFIA